MSSDSTFAASGHRTIRIDTEHFSIRFLVPIVMIATAIVFHFVALRLLRDAVEGLNPACIVLPLDLVVLLGTGYVVERVLKRVMPSRRMATLTPRSLVVTDGRTSPPAVTEVDWDRTVNAVAWRFPVRKRSRVPKGWWCMAVQLVQDDTDVIFYTFKSPKAAEATTAYDRFARLRPRKETESSTDLRAAAEQRRLLKLEDERWHDGAEIAPDDFDALVDALVSYVAGWG